MKLLLSISLLVAVFFCSCSDKEDVEKKEGCDYASIGIEHNIALDSVLNMLKAKKKKGVEITKSEVVKSATHYFENTNDENLKINMKTLLNGVVIGVSSANKLKNQEEPSGSLNSTQQSYILKLKSILKNKNFDESLLEIEELEKNVKEECSVDDIDVILLVSAITKHSMMYWNENFCKWNMEFNSVDITEEINSISKLKQSNNYKDLPDGLYAFPNDPTIFVVVEDGYVAFHRCPPGMVYDPLIQACVFPERTNYWGDLADADLNGATSGASTALVVAIFGGPAGWATLLVGTLGGAVGGSANAIF